MCGVSGIIYKNSRVDGLAPIGADLVRMLEALVHRGSDSSGISVVGEGGLNNLVLRMWTENESEAPSIFACAEEAATKADCIVKTSEIRGQFLRLTVDYAGSISELAGRLVEDCGIEIHSIGRASEVIKDVGTARDMDNNHGVANMLGTHGIGHVRMATESKVDISHSHPFWAYPFPDVTVVHNGQLTNYHKLKRHYQDCGHRFQTGNDSELIAVYLADKMASGQSLDAALRNSLDDLDGTFTYLVSTVDGIGCAKDRWSAKPLVAMETRDVVAIASEEVALSSVFSDEIQRIEPQQNQVLSWSI